MKRRICIYLVMCLLSVFLGCAGQETDVEKIRDLEFTVVATENVPEELVTVLEEKKAEEFYQTYSDGNFMYLCVGYGEQATGGYSITVNELYLTEEHVCMDTTLVGPGPDEKAIPSKSYPYIVICTEYIDRPIMFE